MDPSTYIRQEKILLRVFTSLRAFKTSSRLNTMIPKHSSKLKNTNTTTTTASLFFRVLFLACVAHANAYRYYGI